MIALEGVSKRFGKRLALDGVSFSVEEGEVLGLVGPVGAGKTTTVRILATLLLPDQGSATVAGFSVVTHPRDVRHSIGYLPERLGTYDRQTAREFLELCAGLHGVNARRRVPLSEELLEVVGLAERADDDAKALGPGERRRLGLAGCLVHDPAVLLLDEPLTGLDEASGEEMRVLVVEVAGLGKTVLATGREEAAMEGMCASIRLLDELQGRAAEGAAPETVDSAPEPAGDEPPLTTSAP